MSAQTIFEAFNRCRDRLLPALDGWGEDEVLNELLTGRAQLWAGDEFAAVTQCVGPTRSLHIWLAGGSIRGIMSALPGAIAWARPLGIEAITLQGRKGWVRALRAFGFEGDDLLRKAI
jgi:hypothetical protein